MKQVIIFFLVIVMVPAVRGQQWEQLHADNECSARHENSLTVIGERLVLVGGRGMRPVESWDPGTGRWTTHSETPLEMSHFQAITFNDELWVVGAFTGEFPHETPIPDIYIYNLEKDEWRKGPSIPEGRRRGAAGAVVYKNKIYLVGGEVDGHFEGFTPWFDVYDPAENTWKKLPDAPHARDHVSVAVVNDKLVVAGGRQSLYKEEKVLETTIPYVDVYDFESGRWTSLPESSFIPTERAGATAVAHNGRVLIIGGESGEQVPAHREVEAFDPETGNWEKLPSLNQGRHGTGAVVLNNKIYIVAGSGNRGGGPELVSMEVYQPENPE